MFFKKKKPLNPSRILIIRFSSIGDIVLTTPIIRCLKKQYPKSTIHFLVKKQFKSIVENNTNIDIIHTYDKDLNETISELSNFKFDYIIDLQKNIRSCRIRLALQAPTFSFPKLNIPKWIYVNLKWNLMPDQSIVERYFKAVEKLGVKNDGQGLDYFIPDDQQTQLEDIPFGHWQGFVGCVIGGSFSTKKLPTEKWINLCKLLPYPIILLGGNDDKTAGELITASDNTGKIYNACGKFNINESADLVQRAKVIVTNDTGLMHIAAAFQKPIVSLWGNTTPWFGMFPYYGYNNLNKTLAPQSMMIEIDKLSCRPCSKIGYNQCPKKHFNCMNKMQEIEIVNKIIHLWQESKK